MTFKKTRFISFVFVISIALLLTACGKNGNSNTIPDLGSNGSNISETSKPQTTTEPQTPSEQVPTEPQTTLTMVDAILEKIEQPSLMDAPNEMVADLYHLDPTLLEEFTIRMPMMNVKTNEIAILKVKNTEDISIVEEAVKQRAADVQKQFEQYLPDQYENAKNYKLIVKDNYVLFVISEQADDLVNEFMNLFE